MHETHLTELPIGRQSLDSSVDHRKTTTSKAHATDVSRQGGVREVLLFVSVTVFLTQTKELNL